MPYVDLEWLGEHVSLPDQISVSEVAQALVRVGIEEESIITSDVQGPLVIGQVQEFVKETHSNGKTISWCQVEVGEPNLRGIVCGAPNISKMQKVIVALPGAVLPGGFAISARKTYGHISDGMICSERELGISDEHEGIMDVTSADPEIGSNALDFLHLNQSVLEINITPDRGYEYSYRGIGRELHHSKGFEFKDKVSQLRSRVPATTDSAFQAVLDDQAPINGVVGCNRFVTRVIEGIDPQAPSPEWLRRYLANSGMRSISLVVDISNYVMLDLGQPIHCYDYETLTEPIVVRRALPGETLQTLDMQTRKLNPEDLLITDSPAGSGSRIIGLAGTMGGLDTEITESTTKVMVEAAYFEPVTIARTAKRHKLPSEASRRYERGIDTNLQTAAAQQCVELLVKYGGPNVKVSDRVGDFNIQKPSEPVQFRASKVQKVFGVKVELSQIREILEDIGCEIVSEKRVEPADILAKPSGTSTSANKVEDEVLAESGDSELTSDNTVFTLRTPSWRSDLKIDVDFVEEIARILDYNSVEARLPVPTFSFSSFPGLTKSQKTVRSLSKILSANGFTEVLSYPFVGANLFEKLLIDSEDPRSYLVKLANPLAEQRAYLRSQILQTLLETAQRNVFRGNENLKLYEVGSVYLAQNFLDLGVPQFPGGSRPKSQDLEVIEQGMPAQPLKLAGVWHGAEILKTPENSEKLVDWSSIFEILSVLGQALNKTLSLDQPNSQTPVGSPFHPERSAYIVTESKVLGEIGELHPQVCVNLQLRPRTVAFEINLNSLFIDSDSGFFSVHPISKYPLVKQDFSFLMPDDLPINQVQTRITELLGDELESLALIDIYKGDSVSEGLKSVTFALKIRSFHETLHPEQIEKIRARIIGDLNLAEVRLRD